MTPQELLKLASEDDKLTDTDKPENTILLPEGLLLLGSCEAAGGNHTAEDLFIQIEGNGLRLFWRDPLGTPDDEKLWGSDWEMNSQFSDFEDLRAFAYTL